MKATQLEQMREDFVYIKTTKSVIEDKIEQLNEVRMNFIFFIFGLKGTSCVYHILKCFIQCVKDLKHKHSEKEDRYKSLASLDEMHAKKEELRKQMAWALVSFCLAFLTGTFEFF